MQLITIDLETGLATSAHTIPANVAVTSDDGPINQDGQRFALVDGSLTRVWDLRGFGCFGGADGRTPSAVPADTPIGASWDDLAALTSSEHPYGLLRAPRPETRAEKTAREAAEAQAAADAAAAEKAHAVISMAQFRKALLAAGLLDSVISVMNDPATPQVIAIDWEYATEVRRVWPMWSQFLPLIGKTEADLDAIFDLAKTL